MRRNLNPLKPQNILNVSPSGADYKTITEALAAASSGDCIAVYPGTYSEQIVLKNGVDINFIGKVTVTSALSTGTITDNNTPISCSLYGDPIIENTSGIYNQFKLHNSSIIGGDFKRFYECILRLTINQNSLGTVYTIKNTFPFSFTNTRTGAGKFEIKINSPTDEYWWEEEYLFINASVTNWNDASNNIKDVYARSEDGYSVIAYLLDGTGNFLVDSVCDDPLFLTIHFMVDRFKIHQN